MSLVRRVVRETDELDSIRTAELFCARTKSGRGSAAPEPDDPMVRACCHRTFDPHRLAKRLPEYGRGARLCRRLFELDDESLSVDDQLDSLALERSEERRVGKA